MMPSRRYLLKAAAMAAAGTWLPVPAFALEAAPGRPETSRAAWADLVGETFSVHRRNGLPIELRLHSVEDVASADTAALAGHDSAFSLLFEGPRRPVLRQGTHELWGFGATPLGLFLVPVDHAQTEQRYEAIFNNPVN
jgi:hypothetical protein